MYFDTHAHYDSGAFNADRYESLGSMPASNVGLIVDPGCDLESSKAAIALAERFDFVYAAVGWHPEDMDKLSDEAYAELERLAEHPKCVAIGEIYSSPTTCSMPMQNPRQEASSECYANNTNEEINRL